MSNAQSNNLIINQLGPRPEKRIAIVGGCGGIGRTLVSQCLSSGLKVAVLDLPQSLAKHPPPKECLVFHLDATDELQVTKKFSNLDSAWNGLDAMVNLCGFSDTFINTSEMSSDTWNSVIEGNLKAAFLCAKFAIPLLRKAETSAIVNFSSGLAYKGISGTAAYGAAKAGVIALSKSLATENAPSIRVNVIAPGAVDTEFLYGGTGRNHTIKNPQAHININHYKKTIPFGRLATPQDVSGPTLFLCGDASRFITGQVIHINGGGYMP